jgi:hypothetical protein
VVDDRGARQPTEKQGARNKKDAEVPKTLEEGGYQVTPPTNAVGASSGRSPTNICGVERIERLAIAGLAIAAMGACGPFCLSGKVTVANARVDPTYSCPNPSNKFSYDVHGTMDVNNSTSNTLTIKSMSEVDTLVAVHGSWTIGSLGEKFGGPIDIFSPKSIKPGDKATIKFTIKFDCTNSGPSTSTYGDFDFKFTVVTSAGTFTLSGANQHRLAMSSQ